MHPGRPYNSPPHGRSAARRGTTPSGDTHAASFNSHPSLPSIRQLHLPPTGMSQQQASSSGEGSGYNYPIPPHFASHGGQQEHHVLGGRRASEVYGLDSEGDEIEQQGPPKKKRRRQALSCTG
ncbi:hypothetical protein BDZ94DRAFT_1189361 [Collybia nuda]|uniref:Uncharacterized protein n=1 Tax=Collybia nuda TaxID=64659 RepID=A0A9P5YBQ8_9AGAR|nr:hypothetical protein BDZ94DRAFT_1189361 [Collybia nuda]